MSQAATHSTVQELRDFCRARHYSIHEIQARMHRAKRLSYAAIFSALHPPVGYTPSRETI